MGRPRAIFIDSTSEPMFHTIRESWFLSLCVGYAIACIIPAGLLWGGWNDKEMAVKVYIITVLKIGAALMGAGLLVSMCGDPSWR